MDVQEVLGIDEGANDEMNNGWHIQRGIPIATIFAFLLQTAVVAWWAASVNARVDVLERQMLTLAPQNDRVIRLEERLANIQEGVAELRGMFKRFVR